jgi:hypothetical protein
VNQTFRYPPAWQWIGFLAVLLSLVFPLLMSWNSEAIDSSIVAALVGMAVAGVWCVLHFRRYELELGEDGFVIRRLWRAPFSATWQQIVSVRAPRGAQEVEFEKSDGARIKVSGHFPGLPVVLDRAKTELPPGAWAKTGER